LKKSFDNVVQDIHYACSALSSIHSEQAFEQALPYANKVWDRLEKLDNWYSVELKLINNIFFFFPLETGISIAERALKEIERFTYIIRNDELKSSYLLNLTIYLIKNQKYEKALLYANKSIEECMQIKRFEGLAAAYVRKGITSIKIEKSHQGLELIKKGLSICRVLDLNSLFEALTQEVHELTSIDIDLTI
jgi:Rgg/GadR/MutR family transcriptional activator